MYTILYEDELDITGALSCLIMCDGASNTIFPCSGLYIVGEVQKVPIVRELSLSNIFSFRLRSVAAH
jgi:hypothetical protein